MPGTVPGYWVTGSRVASVGPLGSVWQCRMSLRHDVMTSYVPLYYVVMFFSCFLQEIFLNVRRSDVRRAKFVPMQQRGVWPYVGESRGPFISIADREGMDAGPSGAGIRLGGFVHLANRTW